MDSLLTITAATEESINAAEHAVLAILSADRGDSVTEVALRVLESLTRVKDVTISNNTFMDAPPVGEPGEV